jgi:hypothetical protein
MVDRQDAWFTWNTKVMLPGGAFLIVSAGLLAYKYLTLKPDPPRLSSLYDPAQMLLAKAQQVQLNDEKSRLDAALAELNREMAGLDPRYTPQRQRFDTLNSRRHEIVQRLIDLRSRPTRHFGYTPK